jgi:hypothetical protein
VRWHIEDHELDLAPGGVIRIQVADRRCDLLELTATGPKLAIQRRVGPAAREPFRSMDGVTGASE